MGVREQNQKILNLLYDDVQSIGNVWFVDSVNGNDNYSGYDWSRAKATLAAAVSVASAGDTIKIKGEPVETDVVTIDKKLKLVGENPDNNVYPTMFYNTGDYSILSIEANEVEIRNIGFIQNHANPAISVGNGAAVYKVVIENCKFDLWGTGTYAIASPATEDAPDIVIKNCLFRSWATAAILSNWTRAKIEGNHFIDVGSAKTAIVHSPDGGSRPDTQIVNNTFQTYDSTNGVGITVTNTPTAGMLWIAKNEFGQYADHAHCCSKKTGYMGKNYFGITLLQITT